MSKSYPISETKSILIALIIYVQLDQSEQNKMEISFMDCEQSLGREDESLIFSNEEETSLICNQVITENPVFELNDVSNENQSSMNAPMLEDCQENFREIILSGNFSDISDEYNNYSQKIIETNCDKDKESLTFDSAEFWSSSLDNNIVDHNYSRQFDANLSVNSSQFHKSNLFSFTNNSCREASSENR